MFTYPIAEAKGIVRREVSGLTPLTFFRLTPVYDCDRRVHRFPLCVCDFKAALRDSLTVSRPAVLSSFYVEGANLLNQTILRDELKLTSVSFRNLLRGRPFHVMVHSQFPKRAVNRTKLFMFAVHITIFRKDHKPSGQMTNSGIEPSNPNPYVSPDYVAARYIRLSDYTT